MRAPMTSTGLPPLIPLDEAQRRVLDGVMPLAVERVRVEDAAGRILAAAVTSMLTVPPWDTAPWTVLRYEVQT